MKLDVMLRHRFPEVIVAPLCLLAIAVVTPSPSYPPCCCPYSHCLLHSHYCCVTIIVTVAVVDTVAVVAVPITQSLWSLSVHFCCTGHAVSRQVVPADDQVPGRAAPA
ncbi:hypothetical protein EDB87DRAFT_1195106 [Lactarius vividus]|nr:hypothetical protein EDB87DRAFT_1195106 [Lactarius vividus]